MSTPEASKLNKKIRFLIISPNTWGNGETFAQAVKNHRKAGGDKWNVVYMWPGPCYPYEAGVCGWGQVEWSGTDTRPILIQDNRRAADKRKEPIEIGEGL